MITADITPSNPRWVDEVTSSPRMKDTLSNLNLRNFSHMAPLLAIEGYAPETAFRLMRLGSAAEKPGVLNTDSPDFRSAVRHFMFLYRTFHPIQTMMEVPDLLRHRRGTPS